MASQFFCFSPWDTLHFVVICQSSVQVWLIYHRSTPGPDGNLPLTTSLSPNVFRHTDRLTLKMTILGFLKICSQELETYLSLNFLYFHIFNLLRDGLALN